MVSIFDIPREPTTGLQTFAIFITFFFPGLALVVTVIRNAGRLATKQFGLDDWLVSIAMLISLAETVASYFFIKHNFVGIHTVDIPPHDPTAGRIWTYSVQILYNPILALVKSSVLIFLLRLFGQQGPVRRFIIGLNIVNLAQMVGVFFAIVLQCLPVSFNWDPTVRGGRCVEQRILYTSNAAFNILTDLLVLGLPLYIFSDLAIPKRTKVALLFVFLLGFLVTIASIVRMVVLVQGTFDLVNSDDPNYNIGFITSAVETNLAIITASAPALRPLVRDWRKKGGWLPHFTQKATDVEMASAGKPASRQDGAGGRQKRPASSGGKLKSRSSKRDKQSRSGRRPAPFKDIRVKTERELRSQSPRPSQEEAMTINGPMRVSDIQREIDGLVKEIGYDAGEGAPNVRRYPERYYSSESVYPDDDYRGQRDLNEERLSRYGDKRFGVVTPKASGWGASGRPF